MRKIISLAVLFGLILTLPIVFAIVQARQTPGWQIKLDNYLKYRNDTLAKDPLLSGTVSVEQVTRAGHPENFRQIGNRRLVVGNYYWLRENEETLSAPPAEVMCVLIREDTQAKDGSPAKLTYQMLFVAYYSGPVEPNWLVYKGDNPAVIGC